MSHTADEGIAVAEKAYRWGALPFGVLLLLGSVMFPIIVCLIPDSGLHMPPLETAESIRIACLGIAACWFSMGVGFVRREIWGLVAFVVYAVLGTAWHVAIGITYPEYELWQFSPFMNGPIVYGIWRRTRPAFNNRA